MLVPTSLPSVSAPPGDLTSIIVETSVLTEAISSDTPSTDVDRKADGEPPCTSDVTPAVPPLASPMSSGIESECECELDCDCDCENEPFMPSSPMDSAIESILSGDPLLEARLSSRRLLSCDAEALVSDSNSSSS